MLISKYCEKATDEQFVLSICVERSIDVVYPNFSKDFDIISHSTLLEKLATHGLDGYTLSCTKSQWVSESREWWWMELHPVGSRSEVMFHRAQYWDWFNIFINDLD